MLSSYGLIWTHSDSSSMSDLADALFGAKLVGQALDGTPIDATTVQQAAMDANLAASLHPQDELSSTEAAILKAKMIQNGLEEDGSFEIDPGDILQAQLDADIADTFLN